MIRRGVTHVLTGYEVYNVAKVKELTIQAMYHKFLSEPIMSYDQFKDFIEEFPSPMFEGTTFKADIRLVSAADWTEITYKAKQFDKMTKEADLW